MRSKVGGGVLLLASSPLFPPSGVNPGAVKNVRSLAVSLVRCPRPSVVLLSSPSAWASFGGAGFLGLALGKTFSQRLTSQRSCAMPSRSLGLPWNTLERSLWFRMISSVPKPCTVPRNGVVLL